MTSGHVAACRMNTEPQVSYEQTVRFRYVCDTQLIEGCTDIAVILKNADNADTTSSSRMRFMSHNWSATK